jgi:hypothetical protein
MQPVNWTYRFATRDDASALRAFVAGIATSGVGRSGAA